MESRRRPVLLLGVIVVCFTLGIASVLLAPRGGDTTDGPGAPPPATSTTDPGPSPQTTILVLGVDRLDAGAPQLRAVWLVSFRPPGRDLFLLGLPAGYRLAEGLPSLAEQFTWTAQAGPGPDFLAALKATAPQEVQVIAGLDEIAFASMIDYVGGINLNGVPLRGDQALAILSLLGNDPSAMLSTQARLLEALVPPASALGASPDISPLIALIPLHAFLSEPPSYFAARLSPLLPLDSAAVHVDLLVAASP